MKPPFHVLHFIVLLFILLGGLSSFFLLGGNNGAQLVVGIVTSISYVVWGLIHHAMQRDLHSKVVVEYILIGAIAILVLMVVLRS